MLQLLQQINKLRRNRGFLSVEELLALNDTLIFDPFSTLISSSVILDSGNIFYPGVTLESRDTGHIRVGESNIFHSGTYIFSNQGSVVIGNSNQFGGGGVQIKSNRAGAMISIGSNGRYLNGAQIIGCSILGNGTQVIGAVTVDDCELEAGRSFAENPVEERGAVIKGFGVIKKIKIPVGQVLNIMGDATKSELESQTRYHS